MRTKILATLAVGALALAGARWIVAALGLQSVGAILVTGIFFATLVVAKREKTYRGSVPLVTFGGITAAIIATISGK